MVVDILKLCRCDCTYSLNISLGACFVERHAASESLVFLDQAEKADLDLDAVVRGCEQPAPAC